MAILRRPTDVAAGWRTKHSAVWRSGRRGRNERQARDRRLPSAAVGFDGHPVADEIVGRADEAERDRSAERRRDHARGELAGLLAAGEDARAGRRKLIAAEIEPDEDVSNLTEVGRSRDHLLSDVAALLEVDRMLQ